MKASSAPVKFAILAVDVAVLAIRGDEVVVRTMPARTNEVFKGKLALPGGLIGAEEDAETAARRIVAEKAALDPQSLYIEQLYTFSEVNRDPRGRVVAVAYLGLVSWESLTESEKSESDGVRWIPARDLKHLAYDHDSILATALARLRSKIRYTTVVGKILPKTFTLSDLEHAYTTVLEEELDKRNFRKKILKLNIVTPTKDKREGGAFRPAQLYRFVSSKVVEVGIL